MATTTRKKPPAKAPSRQAGRAAKGPALSVEMRDAVALLVLRRPEVHNAFDAGLIRDMTAALRELDQAPEVRAVIILGEGPSFCAGADLAWMREMAGYDRAQNLADARGLASLLQTLDTLSKPTIARVHGPAFGGGVGLVACCDIAIASVEATFSLSEARLGLIPATISPYVIEAIGARQARRYFLSCERFSAAEAFRIGLVHDLAPPAELDARINALLGSLLMAGPGAQASAKALIRAVAGRPIDAGLIDMTAKRIAATRASAEAREGVAAFLGKRSPTWIPSALRKP